MDVSSINLAIDQRRQAARFGGIHLLTASAGEQTMWFRFDSRGLGVIYGLSLFIFVPCAEMFFSGTPFLPSPQKPTF